MNARLRRYCAHRGYWMGGLVMIQRFSLKCLLLVAAFSIPALAQETIFNVPSGDILDKGKVYGEFDFAYLWDASAGSYTPRLVAGIGHRVEVGINVNGIPSPGPSQTTPTPTIPTWLPAATRPEASSESSNPPADA